MARSAATLVFAALAVAAPSHAQPVRDVVELDIHTFSRMDANGDGYVTRDEWLQSRYGPRDTRGVMGAEQHERIFLTLDENRDGELTRQEAAQMPRLAQRFKEADTDGDRFLTRAEVRPLPGLAAGFDLADRNADGYLNQPEFDAAMALGANLYGEGARSAQKRELFRTLDIDGNGVIGRMEAEWRPDIARNFAESDLNNDGRLDVSEFGKLSLFTIAVDRGASADPAALDPADGQGTPALALLPGAGLAISSLANGCWARLHQRQNFDGGTLLLVGPLDVPRLHSGVGDLARVYDSIEVGPSAQVTLYDDENFSDRVQRFYGKQRVANLNEKLGFFEQIASARVRCS